LEKTFSEIFSRKGRKVTLLKNQEKKLSQLQLEKKTIVETLKVKGEKEEWKGSPSKGPDKT